MPLQLKLLNEKKLKNEKTEMPSSLYVQIVLVKTTLYCAGKRRQISIDESQKSSKMCVRVVFQRPNYCQ